MEEFTDITKNIFYFCMKFTGSHSEIQVVQKCHIGIILPYFSIYIVERNTFIMKSSFSICEDVD